MKIYVLGSNSFVEEMVRRKDDLVALGYDGWIHPDYEAHVKGEKRAFPEDHSETADFKRSHNYIREHFDHILESQAILIVNSEKRGIPNYIGGNVLMEMGHAYYHGRPIFFMHGMPDGLSYMDEIKAMDPICLEGDLANIANHIQNLTLPVIAARKLKSKKGSRTSKRKQSAGKSSKSAKRKKARR